MGEPEGGLTGNERERKPPVQEQVLFPHLGRKSKTKSIITDRKEEQIKEGTKQKAVSLLQPSNKVSGHQFLSTTFLRRWQQQVAAGKEPTELSWLLGLHQGWRCLASALPGIQEASHRRL